MKKIRIGSGAGYAGDRIEPAVELMEKGNLDYIIFECLAERTIAIGQQDKMKDPTKGYNQLLEARMRKILKLAKDNHIKVITNMGAANPVAAAEKTAEIAKELGVSGLKIAYVTGDDITPQIEKYYDNDVLELDCKLGDIKESILSTNVYLGAEGIIEALENGADIVITGRVSDPALSIGPLVHEFGWNIKDDADKMGQATLVGHLLECAGQVTGGYYADPGYKDVPDLDRLGFPLIEIDETGKFVVTKVEGSGGLVCEDTCKEQMIYEIHNPEKYLTPDTVADFSLTIPTTLPPSTTGSRRTCCRAMRWAAWRTSSPGATWAGWRDITCRTGTWRGSSSAATHRSTRSRSVTMPWRVPSREHTGRAPTLCRASSRAARATLSWGAMDTTVGFITSRTCKKPPPVLP